jgi:predicted MPP superfamily phosphohydrolase
MSNILVAEDGPSWRELVKEAFTLAGYKCDFAADGNQAVQKLNKNQYSLVCVNYGLRDYKFGKALIRRLCSDFSEIPVIVTTGYPAGPWDEVSRRIKQDVEPLRKRYSNVREIIYKGTSDDSEDEFVERLIDEVQDLLNPYTLQIKEQSVQEREPSEYRSNSSKFVRWLHISDLHFRESYEQDKVLRQLLNDIDQQVSEEGWKPDFIVVTGDIAFSADEEQYQLACEFFNQVLEKTGLTKQSLFLVPGNHDVDWNKLDEWRKFELDDASKVIGFLQSIDAQARKDNFSKFSNYAKFVNDYFRDEDDNPFRPFDEERYFYVKTFDLEAGSISILGLNSAWASAMNFDFENEEADDKGHLMLGEPQVDKAVELAAENNPDLVLALLHHPFDWLKGFDCERTKTTICEECHLVLHGHLHESEIYTQISPEAEAVVLKAGTAYEKRDHKNGYSYVEVNLEDGTGVAHLRRYTSKKRGYWIADTESHPKAGPEVPFDLP